MDLTLAYSQAVSSSWGKHPRKGASPAGQAARGSGALAAFVDVLVEMYWYGEPQTSDRRRRLLAFSRHEETCSGRGIRRVTVVNIVNVSPWDR